MYAEGRAVYSLSFLSSLTLVTLLPYCLETMFLIDLEGQDCLDWLASKFLGSTVSVPQC